MKTFQTLLVMEQIYLHQAQIFFCGAGHQTLDTSEHSDIYPVA